MARECFREKRFSKESGRLIVKCNQIVEDYRQQGLRLTLRQLYYQFVTSNFITNDEKSYKKLSTLVSDARLAGLIDWDAIEDRIRQPRKQSEWDSLEDLVDGALAAYYLPRWKNQEYYIELWVEKDALAGVLSPMAYEYHVTMVVNRGYSSQSAMYEAAERFKEQIDNDKIGILFYLGDHDPSGEDMVRDIRDRFFMFGVDIEVKKIALTIAQVRQYNPPPNPAKITDPRAESYINKFGNSSWEVDALPPPVLQQLICDAIKDLRNDSKLDKILEQEEHDKIRLQNAMANLEE